MSLAAFQLASHWPFVLSACVSLYKRRLEQFTAMCGLITASMMYHTCLGYNVCFNPLPDLGAADYILSGNAGTVYVIEFVRYRRQLSMSFLIYSFIMSTILYPRIYDSPAAGAYGPAMLLLFQLTRLFVFGQPTAYRHRYLSGLIIMLSLAAFLALTYPAQIGTTLYNWIHSFWHMLAGLTFLAYDLLYDHINQALDKLHIDMRETGPDGTLIGRSKPLFPSEESFLVRARKMNVLSRQLRDELRSDMDGILRKYHL